MSQVMRSVKASSDNDKMSELALLRNISDALIRSRYAAALGQTFGGERDLYNILGYQKQLRFEDFWNLYKRGRLGARVIDAPVDETWQGGVQIVEGEKPEDTQLEKAFKELNLKISLLDKFIRLDKMAGIGEYAVLLLGFDDGAPLEEPVVGGGVAGKRKLMYVQPYHQAAAQIVQWDINPKSPRYSLPVMYNIGITQSSLFSSSPTQNSYIKVHFSRILHISKGRLDNEVFGTPELEKSFNTLQDIDKISGGSAEMYWQGALGGKAFSTQAGVTLTPSSLSQMQDEIDEYVNGLRRYIRLQGMEVKDLAAQLQDPKSSLDVQLDLLAGIHGIPKRILVGSERGELASTQDRDNWLSRIANRRLQVAEPLFLRPFVDQMIQLGVLPPPKDSANSYSVKWADLWSLSEKDQADIASVKSTAIKNYVSTPGADRVIPVEIFLEKIMNFTEDDIKRIEDILAKMPKPDLTPDEITALKQAIAGKQSGQDPNNPQRGGQVPGKKQEVPQTNELGDDDIEEIFYGLVDNFNPYHDPGNGQFTDGPGGAADVEARRQAESRGFKIPPAWKNIWVNPDSSGDLQVTGVDTKGRKQYVYSAEASGRNAAQKFARLKQFTADYPNMMSRINSDASQGHEEAKVLNLISKTGFRIGGERDTGAEKQAFGASTLLGQHVNVEGNKVTFNFTGKKGVLQNHTIEDAQLARWVSGKNADERLFNTTPDKVRAYLHSLSSRDYKVKDFRTHVATTTALETMKSMSKPTSESAFKRAVNSVAKVVAAKLGNTPAMAKSAYISPAVWGQWRFNQ